MRKNHRLQGMVARFFARLVFISMLACCLEAQEDERKKDTSFIDSIAHSAYALAWPTATYKSVSIDGFEPEAGGLGVIVKLSGLSGFDHSDLWVKLEFIFRNGELQDVKVRDHNAILVAPFTTMKVLGNLALRLTQDYAKENDQEATPAASPVVAPRDPSPIQEAAKPDPVTNNETLPHPTTAPETVDVSGPTRPAVSIAAVSKDIRAYLGASDGGFSNFTDGDSTQTQGLRLWTLKPAASAKTMTCYPMQVQTPKPLVESASPLIGCQIYVSTKAAVDEVAMGLENELDGTLPPGWTLQRHNGFWAVGKYDYASFKGPGTARGGMVATLLDGETDSYLLGFQLVFPRP